MTLDPDPLAAIPLAIVALILTRTAPRWTAALHRRTWRIRAWLEGRGR